MPWSVSTRATRHKPCSQGFASGQLEEYIDLNRRYGMDDDQKKQLPASFIELIAESELPILVDFWAEWCGPCRTVSPSIGRLAHEFSGRLLAVKVNVDRKPAIAEKFEVQ